MKLIKASTKILTPINGEEILKQIELAARTCYQSEGNITYGVVTKLHDQTITFKSLTKAVQNTVFTKDNNLVATSARILIPKLMNLNHEAMLEFGGMITVRFIVDRGISHELVRHRIASFAQESTRYCNYGKDEHISFIIPCFCSTITEGIYEDTTDSTPSWAQINGSNYMWYTHMLDSESTYNLLLKQNWTPQQARSVLPNSLKTEINVSANIREWRHIFKLRTAKTAHPQMREVMQPLLDEFKSLIPILFDDINY
jgi:thymidylate synthase (FAD)